jgi:hypothetical protein
LRTSNGVSTNQTTKERPWHSYRGEPNWKDLIPGYAGAVDEQQVAFIQEHLMSDEQLSYWWGWKSRGMKRRALAAIERVAMCGSPEDRALNVRLVREFSRRPKEGVESDSVRVKQSIGQAQARPGRRRIESWEGELLRMAASGMGCKAIAKVLQGQGVVISHATVAARLRELKGQLSLIGESMG